MNNKSLFNVLSAILENPIRTECFRVGLCSDINIALLAELPRINGLHNNIDEELVSRELKEM